MEGFRSDEKSDFGRRNVVLINAGTAFDLTVSLCEEEKRGGKKEGDKGAVLELLIEGRCGGVGQQELQISGRDTSCPEGNLRVRIGVQAKRTKKPPKILESYVCKPTIRTYQRQSRGGVLKSSSTTDENREQRVGLDAVQATSPPPPPPGV
uniref:Uncharacterized protein n=1 Tax=Nothobranchius furzeri TaxID=105023 RepID=A0A8C6PPW3_NOTFU